MPSLDRRLYVVVQAAGTRDDQGNFIEGAKTPFSVWATLLNDVSGISLDESGNRIGNTAAWRVRFYDIIRNTPAERVTCYDSEFMDGYQVTSINEASAGARRRDTIESVRDRRRFLDLEMVYSVDVSADLKLFLTPVQP